VVQPLSHTPTGALILQQSICHSNPKSNINFFNLAKLSLYDGTIQDLRSIDHNHHKGRLFGQQQQQQQQEKAAGEDG
jgi:hypothetical protein